MLFASKPLLVFISNHIIIITFTAIVIPVIVAIISVLS